MEKIQEVVGPIQPLVDVATAPIPVLSDIAGRDITLVYGGGNIGLMGALADAVLDGGGRVIGVIPKMLVDKELAHHGLTDLRIVGSMHERKALMAGGPGGPGGGVELSAEDLQRIVARVRELMAQARPPEPAPPAIDE